MFSLYLNNLENCLTVDGASCLESYVYLKVIVLLYADDNVVFATYEETLIQSLNLFSNYCNQWKLNYDKTKVLVLGDRIIRPRHIRIENHIIELLNELKYIVDIDLLNNNRNKSIMNKYVVNQARNSQFSIYRNMFINLVIPILTYGCEVCRSGGRLMYIKGSYILFKTHYKVKQSTPYVMLYGDLGRVPLSISITKRVIGYWYDIINSDNKLSSILYRLILQDNVHVSNRNVRCVIQMK